ncbi:hypothetical protein [Paraburkholderia sediminicola]
MTGPLPLPIALRAARAGSIRAGIRHSMKRALRYLCRLAKDIGDVVRGKL